MKRFFISFSIVVVFLFLGCEQEPNLSSENELDALDSSESQSHDWEYLSIEEIPEINQFLLEKTGKDLAVKNNRDDFGGAIFETENILEVIDSLDNTNYSFAFSFPDTPEHIKYNLIVGKNPDGEISNPFVIKYTSEQGESFQNFQENGSIFPYFKGTISVHRYTDFFKGQLFNKDCSPEHDQYGDPIPCIEESVGSGGSGGGSSGGGGSTGGTSSGGSSSGSGGGSGSCIQYYERCWCNGNLVGSHDHAPTRLVIDCGNINYLKGTYRSVDCPDCETSNGSIGVNFSSNVQKLKDLIRIPNSNTAILNKLQANDALALRIAKILTLDGNTPQAKTEAWMTLATELTDAKWTTSSGQFRGRSSLPYKAKRTISINGQNISQFLLENNDVISYGTYRLCTGCSESQDKTYYYSRPENLWYEYKVPPSPDTAGDLNYLMETIIWESSVFVARYVLPIEDVVILIDGKDFDGVEQSRVQAVGFLIVGIVPGGKVTKAFKPVAKFVQGMEVWGAIAKAGNKTISFGLKKSGEAFDILINARNKSGKALGVGVEIKEAWLRGTDLNAGFFPKSIADKMKNKSYTNFDAFRQAFWKEVANDPNLTKQFTPQQIIDMKKGLSPVAPESQRIGKQIKYVLHHKTPINQGGAVYDMDNLYIVTPKYHKEILSPAYHYGYDY